jgi:hypothetical protein
MTWIGLLLIGVGVADLTHSIRRMPVVPEATGAIAVIVLGMLADLTDPGAVGALVVVAAAVVVWGQTVTRAFSSRSDLPAWAPLAVLGGALAAGVVLSGRGTEPAGRLAEWLDVVALPLISDLPAERFLLLLGVFLVQLSTGNVVVRLVLAATGTSHPARHGASSGPETRLKGGRLLGPMERVLILGLGLAGQVTAASLVVAAKGLLRFPELSSDREQERIHRLTEYFLVGSFVSWLLALGGVALLSP